MWFFKMTTSIVEASSEQIITPFQFMQRLLFLALSLVKFLWQEVDTPYQVSFEFAEGSGMNYLSKFRGENLTCRNSSGVYKPNYELSEGKHIDRCCRILQI